MTIRLPVDQAEALETVASLDGVPVVEVVRAAITEHVRARGRDEALRQKLRDRTQRVEAVLRGT